VLTHYLPVADTAALFGDVFAGIAAGAALVAIVYAKQGAEAARDAVRETRELRIDDEYQALARGIEKLRLAAAEAERHSGSVSLESLRDAQTEVRSHIVLVAGPWTYPTDTSAPEELVGWLEKASDHDASPEDVLLAASVLTRRIRDSFRALQADRAHKTAGTVGGRTRTSLRRRLRFRRR
jgi:hypothetical protein